MTKLKAPAGIMNKPQLAIFKRLAKELDGMPQVAGVDSWAVATAAKYWFFARQMEAQILADGVSVRDGAHGGDARKHPLLAPYQQFLRNFEASLTNLGLTPAGRAKLRMKLDEAGHGDPFAEYLNELVG